MCLICCLHLPHPPPSRSSPLPIISHKSLHYLKSARAVEVVFRGRLISRFLSGRLQQSFPEGIIKPYEGTSLTIGKVCRRPICYRISSHFG